MGGENLLQCNHTLNLDIEGAGKLGADRSTGRGMVAAEIFGINRIHFLKILRTQITEIDSAGDRICKVCSRSFCYSADILKNQPGLLGNAAALDLPGCRIPWRHSGNEEEWASGGNGQRVRAERRRTIEDGTMAGLHDERRVKSETGKLKAEKTTRYDGFCRGWGRPFSAVWHPIWREERACVQELPAYAACPRVWPIHPWWQWKKARSLSE